MYLRHYLQVMLQREQSEYVWTVSTERQSQCMAIVESAGSKKVGHFFRSEIWYRSQNSITNAIVLSPRATNAMLLLHRLEFVQSVTRCEAAAVSACPATPLLLSHCINSRELSPKPGKRHTPLSLLQDPETAQIHDQKQKTVCGKEREFRNALHCLFNGLFNPLSLEMEQGADTYIII